jgi:hypothetical protein
MVAALWLSVVVFHLLIPAILSPIPTAYLAAADVATVILAAVGGWWFRRSLRGTTKERIWDAWEASVGTGGIAVLAMGLAAGLLFWAQRGHPTWLGTGVASLVVGGVALVWATGRKSSEPLVIIPDGEQPEPVEDFQRAELSWSLDRHVPGLEGTVGLWIQRSTVAAFAARNPLTKFKAGRPQFEWYVQEGVCDEVNSLADRLSAISRQHGLSRFLEMCLVLDLVQRLPYVTDLDSKGVPDYWRFPLETLSDQCGDCDDFAILAVALLSAMGHRTCFFDLPGHVAVGVAELPIETGVGFEAAEGVIFYYVETTATGWVVGELPDGVDRGVVRIAAVVAALRARKADRSLQGMAPGGWSLDSKLSWRLAGLVACLGLGLAGALAWLSV